MHTAIELCKRGQDLNELGMQKEEYDVLIAAVEAAREYAQRQTASNTTILWDTLEFTRKRYG